MNDTMENGTNSSIFFMSSENDTELALRTAVNYINLILVLPSNSYVLWLILSGAGGTIASEFFYLNLTASMIISSLASLFHFAWLFTHNFIFATVKSFAFAVFFFVSVPSFQCCICVERYVAVVHPVVFLRYKALRYRVACSCAVWLMALAFSFGFLFNDLLLDITRQGYVFLGFYIVCISVMSFCCLSVLRALKQPGPGEGQRDNGEGNNMKRRAFRIILISLVVMVVTLMSYIPYVLLQKYSSPVVLFIMYIIVLMSMLVLPLLYIHKAGKLPCFTGL